MMDFDRKSGGSDGKARNGRDPLMELMRLFGNRAEDETVDHEESGRETVTEFPSGEFPSLGVAYPPQDYFDDHHSFSAGESAGADYSFFPEAVAGDEVSADGYGVRLTEDEIRNSAYYGVEYGGDGVASGQEPFFTDYAVQNADYQNGGACPPGTTGDEEGYFPAEVAGYQKETLWAETSVGEDQAPEDSVFSAVGYESSVEGASSREYDYPEKAIFSHTDEDRYDLRPKPESHFQSEGDSSNESAVIYAGGQEYERAPATGYPVSAVGEMFRKNEQVSSAGSQVFSVGAIDTDGIFDDGFFAEDAIQETTLEPSDYETALQGIEVCEAQALSADADAPAWDGADFATGAEEKTCSSEDENIAAVSRKVSGYQVPESCAAVPAGDVQACRRDDIRPLQTYYGQIGQGYSYVVQPVIRNPDDVHAGDFTDRAAVAEHNATAMREGFSGNDAGAFVDDEGGHYDQAQYHNATGIPHDFDMTDRSERTRKGKRVRDFGAAGFHETGLEETEPFDLPPVDYGDEAARLRIEDAFDQEFADIFETDTQTSCATSGRQALQDEENELFPIPEYDSEEQDGFPQEKELSDDEEQARGVYDWASPAALAAAAPLGYAKDYSRTRRKWFYRTVILGAFVAAASGAYMFYFPGDVNENTITVIHAEQSDIKVKPDSAKQDQASDSDQAVYNSVEGNPSTEVEQEKLIDRTETPVDIHKMDEQPPASTESGLDRSSLENLVRQAAAHSVPIHIVPTVLVSPDRKVITVSQPDQPPVVLMPGHSTDAVSAVSRPADVMNAAAQPATGASVDASGAQVVQKAVNEIREPQSVIADSSVSVVRQLADPAKGVTPPAVIPEKPLLPVQVAVNTGKEMLSEQQDTALQARSAFDGNSGVMTLNDFYVQISSQPSKEAAEQSVRDAKQRFAAIIGRNDVVIVPAVIPNRGTYYRVRVPIGDYNAAVRICEQYKQAGGNCFIGR